MKKHPSSLKLGGDLAARNTAALTTEGETVLYDGTNFLARSVYMSDVSHIGPVRDLCALAPNNVNTMAAASIAAVNLGFGQVRARLVADPRLVDLSGVVFIDLISAHHQQTRRACD
jgi:aspartate dehydrogenase